MPIPETGAVKRGRALAHAILRDLRSGDAERVRRATERLGILPKLPANIGPGHIQLKHTLEVVAREAGYTRWDAFIAAGGAKAESAAEAEGRLERVIERAEAQLRREIASGRVDPSDEETADERAGEIAGEAGYPHGSDEQEAVLSALFAVLRDEGGEDEDEEEEEEEERVRELLVCVKLGTAPGERDEAIAAVERVVGLEADSVNSMHGLLDVLYNLDSLPDPFVAARLQDAFGERLAGVIWDGDVIA